MKNKPIGYNIFSVIFAIISISLPIQVAMLYGHSFSEFVMIYHKLNFLNLMVMAITMVNAILSFRVSMHLIWTLPLSVALISVNNSIVFLNGNDFAKSTIILSTAAYSLFILVTMKSKLFSLIETQDTHWWKVPTRYKKSIPVKLKLRDKELHLGSSYDLSQTGAFLQMRVGRFLYEKGDVINVRIGNFRTKAKVVRLCKEQGTYPEGIGLQFVETGILQKMNLYKQVYL